MFSAEVVPTRSKANASFVDRPSHRRSGFIFEQLLDLIYVVVTFVTAEAFGAHAQERERMVEFGFGTRAVHEGVVWGRQCVCVCVHATRQVVRNKNACVRFVSEDPQRTYSWEKRQVCV